jgi:hypothetical protein
MRLSTVGLGNGRVTLLTESVIHVCNNASTPRMPSPGDSPPPGERPRRRRLRVVAADGIEGDTWTLGELVQEEERRDARAFANAH